MAAPDAIDGCLSVVAMWLRGSDDPDSQTDRAD